MTDFQRGAEAMREAFVMILAEHREELRQAVNVPSEAYIRYLNDLIATVGMIPVLDPARLFQTVARVADDGTAEIVRVG